MGQFDRALHGIVETNNEVAELNEALRKIGDIVTRYYTPASEQFAESSNPYPRENPKTDNSLAIFAHKMYLSRRDRDKNNSFPGLYSDPAWDILLDLFISHASNKFISVTDASIAGHVAVSTALRWIFNLEKAGLIERKPDKSDKRRCFVMLSEDGLAYMRKALDAMSERMKPPLFSA